MKDAAGLVKEFMGNEDSATVQIQERDARAALTKDVEAMDRAVLATEQSGEIIIFGIRDGRIMTMHRRGDVIDTVEWGALRGLRVIVHRKVLDVGLLENGYTLDHPTLGHLEIHPREIPATGHEAFVNDLRPFTASGLGH